MPEILNEPHSIVAVTDSGLSFPCAFRPDGVEWVNWFLVRNYRVFIEFDWERSHVVRFDIANWPDDVCFVFDVPNLSTEDAAKWAAGIVFNEVKPPRDDDGIIQRIRVT